MKKYRLILIGMLALLMAGCKDDLARTGSSILDPGDSIVVIADTFEISSRIYTSGAIVSLPDSMLLGEIETDYGTMRAQILTQLTCPEGFQYPDNAVIDSISLIIRIASFLSSDRRRPGSKETPSSTKNRSGTSVSCGLFGDTGRYLLRVCSLA